MMRRSFDLLARPYRLLETLTFGRALQRARTGLLAQLPERDQALVLGDGDGRFLAKLLRAQPRLQVLAVDASTAMLAALRRRCVPLAPRRLETAQADARSLALPGSATFDLVCTHFFLDCLSTAEVERLVARLRPHLRPGALWLLSDFRVPPRPWPLRLAGRVLVGMLYAAFRVLTGLRTRRLPEHGAALAAGGLELRCRRLSLAGLLTTELWQLPASNEGQAPEGERRPCRTQTARTLRLPTTLTP